MNERGLNMPSGLRVHFEPENCIQCHACETACKSWRNIELGVNLRKIIPRLQGEYPDVKYHIMSVACRHCEDPACAAACPEHAIEKRDTDGVVLVNRETCSGCQICFDECPYRVPQFGCDGTMQKCDLCNGCLGSLYQTPPCVATCPTNALILTR